MRFGESKDPIEAAHNANARLLPLQWLNGGRFGILLALVIGASFPCVLLGLRAFAYGDAGQFAYPVGYYSRESFYRGEIPFWNPLSSCGIPFMAQWNTMTLYPASIFYLLLPVPWSFDVFCLAHLWLGGMGMYCLARRWTGNRTGAGLAGLVFAFNGLTWYGVMWPHLLAALGWMPWVILFMERAQQEGGRFSIYAALMAGIQLLSGGVEAILQTWIVLAVFWVWRLFQSRQNVRQAILRGSCPLLLGAGLAMMQLLPFLELLQHSQRTSALAGSDYGKIASMPLTGWVNYLVPLFHCRPNFNGVFMQVGQPWTGSYFLGTGVVALALLAVLRVKDAKVRLLVCLALFGLIMAFGASGYLQDIMVRLLPVLGFIRFSVKYVILPTFALPLLAAFGVAWLIGAPPEKWPVEWNAAKRVVIGLLVLLVAIVGFDKLRPSGGEPDLVLINAIIRAFFLFGTLASVALVRLAASAQTKRLGQIALLLCVWLDVLTHSPNLSPTVSASAWEPDVTRQSLGWDSQTSAVPSRFMRNKLTFWTMLTHGLMDPDSDLRGRRLSLFMDLNLLENIAKFDGFYALDVKEHLDVFKHAYFTTNNASGLLDFLSISEIGNPSNVLAWTHRDTALPLITAGQKPVCLAAADTLEAVFANKFTPAAIVYLPTEARDIVRATRSANAQILSPKFRAGRVEFGVRSDRPAIVVVAQTFYPAWHAYIDGKATPLWRANYAFQALESPPGQHQVSLIYEDRRFFWGAVISASSLLICGAAWFWFRARAAPPEKII